MNAKLISVWGAAGSGKTTFAVNLALSLAERNCMVGIISSKMYYGEIQSFFGKYVESQQGLYQALTDGNTKNRFSQAENSVFFLSTPNEFDGLLLGSVSMESVKEMLYDAAMRFDYIILDGSEELNNPISSVGMAEAAQVFILHYPCVKGCAWYKSMDKNILELLNIKSKSVHILNAYDRTCDKMAYMRSVGTDFTFELPFVEKAKIYENSGSPIYSKKNLFTKNYRRTMDNIASLAML